MQAPESIILTVIITTLLLLFFSGSIIYFLFLYQRKRYQHHREIMELREIFNQTLLQSKLEIQEHTLDHIAKELHANFSHLVSLININLSEVLTLDPTHAKESVIETKSLAKQLLSELKALSASLNTDHIMHVGFTQALSNELNRLRKTRKYQVVLNKSGGEYRLPQEHEIILFRLCQEILNNIIKHAKATSIQVSLNYLQEEFTLEFSDDGIGFDIDSILNNTTSESTGLLNIKKRAKLINAEVEINSDLNKGTFFRIKVPLTPRANG
jgi:signal transduction histidine kinase